jgi:hypothetical protein
MRPWLALTFCLFAVGCISTNVERLDFAVRPARSPDSVAILLETPERPYTVIAVIESNGKSVFDTFDDLRNEMIGEAAELGGDAVILEPESTISEFILTGTAMIKSDTKKLSGSVVVFDR